MDNTYCDEDLDELYDEGTYYDKEAYPDDFADEIYSDEDLDTYEDDDDDYLHTIVENEK